tara:strand:+ start:874 stop:1353 length:480 start_codon:yes stop_codon:yes gene_type:complete
MKKYQRIKEFEGMFKQELEVARQLIYDIHQKDTLKGLDKSQLLDKKICLLKSWNRTSGSHTKYISLTKKPSKDYDEYHAFMTSIKNTINTRLDNLEKTKLSLKIAPANPGKIGKLLDKLGVFMPKKHNTGEIADYFGDEFNDILIDFRDKKDNTLEDTL